ncbi:MAG: hypothetical protein AAGD38_16475 [Acidobacteriota bacterium]
MRNGQRGESKLGCIVWILILIAGGIAAARIIPVKISEHQLKDKMEEMAALHPRWDENKYRNAIINEAASLDIPLEKGQVKVKKEGTRSVTMEVQTTVPVDLIVTEIDWDIHIKMRRDIFIF